MTKKKKTALTVSGIALGIGVLTVTSTAIAAKILADMAVNKKLPGSALSMQGKIAGGSLPEETKETALRMAEQLEKKVTDTVTIINREGLRLNARWYHAENPKRIVIAMHGWRSHWNYDFCASSDFLHDEGCSVLYPDQRSQGDSEGKHISFGAYERFDCIDWLNYVIYTYGEDIPIYLCGVSMGATTVLLALGFNLPPSVKGIIADCGYTSPDGIWKYVAKNNLHIKNKLIYFFATHFINRKVKLDSGNISTVEALKKAKIPVLFIHGDSDKFVPVSMTYENYKACASKKRMLIVPGADHGVSYLCDMPTYQSYVRDFFKECEK